MAKVSVGSTAMSSLAACEARALASSLLGEVFPQEASSNTPASSVIENGILSAICFLKLIEIGANLHQFIFFPKFTLGF